jgi:ABC-type multidrug transport system ATPase subunit
MPALKVTTLTKRFGSRLVIDKLSFEVDDAIVAVAGRNGSGKTTLMRCLAGLIRPSSGTVVWNFDDKIAEREMIRRNVGLAGPWLQLYREMTCTENLTFLAKLHQLPKPSERVRETLDLVGLSTQSKTHYGSLSSGQQQRLKIASAILHQPTALLLDEPGSNLDEAGTKMIAEVIMMWRSPGKLAILASNDARELDLCDRSILVSQS